MTLLRIRSLTKRYQDVAALDGFDLDVAPGSRTAVVGPSGSGKSTLLRMIAGFDVPDSGTIDFDGRSLVDGTTGVPAHRRGIGVVAQDGALFPHLSVADNIGFGLARRAADRGTIVRDLMRLVDLPAAMLDRRPHELSGGQQQRVALARALARKPRLMLLDEPFSALDPALRESTREATADVLRAADIATILVTHDQGEALSFADHVVVLRDGRLSEAGSPQDLYLRPRLRETALFLGDAIILTGEARGRFVHCALGTLATAVQARPGPVEVMLRPEQIRLIPVRSGDDIPRGTDRREFGEVTGLGEVTGFGEVTGIAFGGASCLVTLRLGHETAPGTAPDPPFVVRSSGADLPTVGSLVRIAVTGTAHVLPPATSRGKSSGGP